MGSLDSKPVDPPFDDMVSLIVPIFNAAHYLHGCITSLRMQTHTNIEIILVNDGSGDGSAKIIDYFANQDDRIRVIHKLNEGVSVARNCGLDVARGAYICFVDSDDWLSPYFIETFLSIARQHDADFILSKNTMPAPDSAVPESPFVEIWSSNKAIENLFYPRIRLGCWNKLYRRSLVLDHHIRFDDRFFMGEGLKFITEISACASKIVAIDSRLYYYRRDNPKSATSGLTLSKMKNALAAIDDIHRSLDGLDQSAETSICYHRWNTAFYALIAFYDLDKPVGEKDFSRDCMSYVKKQAFNILLRAKISNARRLLVFGGLVSSRLSILFYRLAKRYRHEQ